MFCGKGHEPTGREREMETIESFCDRHEACADGKKWALDNCSTMCDVWERAKPEYLVWIATRDGVIDDKTMRLFACWCVRQVWHLLDDERSRNAVVVSEKFANGVATKEELAAAWAAARDAAWDAAWAAARAAAWDAAWAAARDAARAAARDAAWAAARDAARDAAWDAARDAARAAACAAARAAARDAARDAAWEAQAKWLRENAKPNFKLAGSVR